jgi:arylsulfatase A-like enzyme
MKVFLFISFILLIGICLNKPNVVIILTEDLGYGDVGVYGNVTVKTPRLDNLAAEGLKFNNFYTAATLSSSRYLYYSQ